MFYQPIIMNEQLFSLNIGAVRNFALHWHSDLEIIACRRGSLCVIVSGQTYRVTAGDTIIIGSCEPHEVCDCSPDLLTMLLRVGSMLFGELFTQIMQKKIVASAVRNDPQTEETIRHLERLYTEEATLDNTLCIRSYAYMLTALLLRDAQPRTVSDEKGKRIKLIMKIQKTLDYVSVNFDRDISVEKAAEIAGYEKSSFCRIFKQATDVSFHQYLSEFRIKKACVLLHEDYYTISEVAEMVGFQELKTFCRLFKQIVGMTPNEYRKQDAEIHAEM